MGRSIRAHARGHLRGVAGPERDSAWRRERPPGQRALGEGTPRAGRSGLVLALVLGLLTTAEPAAAQWAEPPDGDPPLGRSGAYVGLAGFYALQNFDDQTAIDTASDIDATDTGGVSVKGGFRIDERWAVDVAFQYFGEFELASFANDGTPLARDEFDGWTLMLNGRMFLHSGTFQPFLSAGAGALVMHKTGPDGAFAMRLGGGLDVYLTDHLVLDNEVTYVLPAPKLEDFQYMTATFGLTWRY